MFLPRPRSSVVSPETRRETPIQPTTTSTTSGGLSVSGSSSSRHHDEARNAPPTQSAVRIPSVAPGTSQEVSEYLPTNSFDPALKLSSAVKVTSSSDVTSTSSDPSPSGRPSSHSPSDQHATQDIQEQMAYCYNVLRKTMAFLNDIIRYSPDSYRWAKLVGDDWRNERHFRPLLLNWLTESITTENRAGIDNHSIALSSGHAFVSQRYWDAALGLAQFRFYLAKGIPVLYEKLADGDLLLQGNRSSHVLGKDWSLRS